MTPNFASTVSTLDCIGMPLPLAHAFIPLPTELITYCQLNSQLVNWQAQAWLFAYLDASSHELIAMQALRAHDIPAVLAASITPWHQEGWRNLSLIDVPSQTPGPNDARKAMLLRRQYLLHQLDYLNQQIATKSGEQHQVRPDHAMAAAHSNALTGFSTS